MADLDTLAHVGCAMQNSCAASHYLLAAAESPAHLLPPAVARSERRAYGGLSPLLPPPKPQQRQPAFKRRMLPGIHEITHSLPRHADLTGQRALATARGAVCPQLLRESLPFKAVMFRQASRH